MRTLVVLPNWVGDAVMATPLLRALKQSDPAGSITVAGKGVVCDVLQGLGSVDHRIVYGRGHFSRVAKVRTVWGSRHERFDAAVMLPNSLSSALIGVASRAKRRVGFASRLRLGLLTHPVQRPMAANGPVMSTIESYLHLGASLGARSDDRRMELVVRDEDAELTDQFFKSLGLRAGERPVVLNVGGAFGAAKRWPVEQAAKFSRRVVAELGCSVVVHCGPGDRDDARAVVEAARTSGVYSMADFDPLPLGLSRGVLGRASMVLTTDSGPRHMAVALGVPTVTLFGPTDPYSNRTHAAHERPLWDQLPCSPCWKRECPLGHHQCMKGWTADRVFGVVARVLETDHRLSA